MEIATKLAPLGLALIMLGLGLSLTIQDFIRVVKIPKDFLVGFISQMILLPIIALLIAMLLNLSAELGIGLMLIACAPGGVTSNVLTKFAGGDVALSISLTAVVSLISIISVPFIMFTSMDVFEIGIVKEVSMISIALKMFLVVTVPVIIGMIIRHFAKNFVDNQASLIQKISVILFMLVFAAIYIEEWDNIITYFAQAGLPVLLLNMSMMVLGFYIAKVFASGVAQQRCISIECGLQNGTLALFVGTQIFGENITTFIIPTAAYALIMMITSIIFIFILRKNT
ncbi:bile acid:sodium symporter family protein [Candidatus Pelagibacter sp.]|nr:bile acid:sodium symporter family protein [Candidatus Pelagibacter sp.]